MRESGKLVDVDYGGTVMVGYIRCEDGRLIFLHETELELYEGPQRLIEGTVISFEIDKRRGVALHARVESRPGILKSIFSACRMELFGIIALIFSIFMVLAVKNLATFVIVGLIFLFILMLVSDIYQKIFG